MRPTDLGWEIWRGPSELDGGPIVLLVSPLRSTSNRKTGQIAQLYIMRRDVRPSEAMLLGLDASMCGDCEMRHFLGGDCYVQGAASGLDLIWDTWRDEEHPSYRPIPIPASEFFGGMAVRLTAYGDLASLPPELITQIVDAAADVRAYTQRWRTLADRVPGIQKWCRASVHSEAEAGTARAMGWPVFRVRPSGAALLPSEVDCPNQFVGALRCAACRLCTRAGAVSVRIH